MFREITNHSGQNANNTTKLYRATDGCCGEPTAACQYDVTIPTANAVNSITIKDRKGVNKELTTGFPVTGAANVRAAIKAAIVAEGYEDDDDTVVAVSSEAVSTNTIYHITGDLIVVSMKHNTSTVVNAVAKCTRTNRCTFFYAWPGSASATTFTINGVDASLASQTLAGMTAAQVKTAIEALANWPTTAVLTVVETATAFELTILDYATNTYVLGGVTFVRSNCATSYKA
jgi:hypothetical protein